MGLGAMISRLEPQSTSTFSNDSVPATGITGFCQCNIFADTLGVIWYDEVFTTVGPTLVYTIDQDTHSTIGSSLKYSNVTSIFEIPTSLYSLEAEGGIETITFNSTDDIATELLVQTNYFGDISVDIYTAVSTTGTGPSASSCAITDTYSGTLPSYPDTYTLIYTSSIIFNHSDPSGEQALSAEFVAGDIGTYIASFLGVPNCTLIPGAGVGGVKIGVTILTETSSVYVSAVADKTTTTPVPPTTTTQPTTMAPSPALTSTIVGATAPVTTSEPFPKSYTTPNDRPSLTYPSPNPTEEVGGVAPSNTASIETLYSLPRTTLSAGGPAETLPSGGLIVSADSTGLVLLSTVHISSNTYTRTASQESSAVIESLVTVSDSTGMAGLILSGLGITVATVTVSTEKVTMMSQVVSVQTITAGGSAVEVASIGGGVVVGSQTLTSGGVVTVGGETVSLGSGGGVMVGSSTVLGVGSTSTGSVDTKGTATATEVPVQVTGGAASVGGGFKVVIGGMVGLAGGMVLL